MEPLLSIHFMAARTRAERYCAETHCDHARTSTWIQKTLTETETPGTFSMPLIVAAWEDYHSQVIRKIPLKQEGFRLKSKLNYG